MTEILARSVWPGLLVWVGLYSCDYLLTQVTARLYHSRAKQKIVLEGSLELNPLLERDVDSLRLLSPRFAAALIVISFLITALWYLTMRVLSWPEPYFFVLGAIVFLQLPVQMRHLRNLFLFTTALGEGGIRGRIEYPRWVLFSVSSFEFVTFAGLFATVYVFTESVMVLGGIVTCLLMAAKQWVLARRATRKTAAAPQGEDAAGA